MSIDAPSYYDFWKGCDADGIRLHSRVHGSGSSDDAAGMSYFQGVPMMAPFIAVGAVLRNPPSRLAKRRPGGKELLTADYASGSLAAALKTAVNSSLQPAEDSFSLNSPHWSNAILACSEAEGYFMGLEARLKADAPHRRVDVFANDAGVPLLVRKPYGVSSALSLAPLALNGVVLPPYSIFRVEAAGDVWVNEYSRRHDGTGVRLRPPQDITSIGFQRPSAFSVPPGAVREAHFGGMSFPGIGVMEYDAASLAAQVTAVAI